jgi:D-3-phosphoglycerate dehydrogenase
MLNKSRGDVAYTLVDVDQVPPDEVVEQLGAIQGVLNVRVL